MNDTLGYALDVEYKNKGLAFLIWLLSKIGPLKELVNGSLMWLKAEESGKLLDIGRGNSYFLAQMRDLSWNVIGVDIYLFSLKSLITSAEKVGLKMKKVFTPSVEAYFTWLSSRIIKMDCSLPKGTPEVVNKNYKLEALLFWESEYLLTKFWQVGEEIVMEAEK